MRRSFSILAVAAVAAIGLPGDSFGQAKAPASRGSVKAVSSRTGSIEGDVYLVMRSGDTKKGAGRTILLLRDSDSLRQRMSQTCEAWRVVRDSLDRRIAALSDSIMAAIPASVRGDPLYDQLRARRSAIYSARDSARTNTLAEVELSIFGAMADTTGTGMNAHYRFSGVKPGKYILFGDWRIGDNAYQWWAPVVVAAGQTLRKDLDNSTEAEGRVYCGIL